MTKFYSKKRQNKFSADHCARQLIARHGEPSRNEQYLIHGNLKTHYLAVTNINVDEMPAMYLANTAQ